MNSYPIELLVQHAPLMFVAGLDVSSPTPLAAQPKESTSAPGSDDHNVLHAHAPESRDPFITLQSRLRAAFSARRRGVIWDTNKSKHFDVIVVDKVGARLLES